MQSQTASIPHGVPESFYSKFGHHVTAILSGFDRIRFRGTLRMLFEPPMMEPLQQKTGARGEYRRSENEGAEGRQGGRRAEVRGER